MCLATGHSGPGQSRMKSLVELIGQGIEELYLRRSVSWDDSKTARNEFVATNEVGVVLPEDVVVDDRADVQRAETLVREAVGVFERGRTVVVKYAHRQSAEAELNWVEGPGRAAAETEERDCEEGPEDELVRGERRRGRRSKRAESDDSRVIYTRERLTASVVVVVKGQESSVVVEGGELRMTIHEWFTLVNGRRRRWWWSKVKSRWWWSKAENQLKGAESDDSRVVYTRKRSTVAVVAEGQESSVVVEGGELRMTIQTRVSAPPQKRIVEAGGKEGSARGGNGSGTSERGRGAGGSLTKKTTACAAALASQRVVRGGGRRGCGCCVAAADVCVGRGSSVRKAETAQQDLGGRAPWSTSDLHPLTLLATKGQVAVGGFVGKRWRGTVFTTVNSLALASYAVNERSTLADPLLVVLSRWVLAVCYSCNERSTLVGRGRRQLQQQRAIYARCWRGKNKRVTTELQRSHLLLNSGSKIANEVLTVSVVHAIYFGDQMRRQRNQTSIRAREEPAGRGCGHINLVCEVTQSLLEKFLALRCPPPPIETPPRPSSPGQQCTLRCDQYILSHGSRHTWPHPDVVKS
ncbi:hypothetical protein K438DRAFT_1788230 [Mycena galopus ATCC 62051]|nr:hypothetical protein K438DRAFT_1788230 [Mycena galopus ATCC 62051]